MLISNTCHAILISSSFEAELRFDLSGGTLTKPYSNLILLLKFDKDIDDYGPDDSFSMQTFNSIDIAVSETSIIGPFNTQSGGAIEVTFGGPLAFFTGLLETDSAYVKLTNIHGAFELTSVTGKFYSSSDNQIESFTAEINRVPIPETPTIYILMLGLFVMIVLPKHGNKKNHLYH